MKKKVLTIAGGVLGVGIVFAAGTFTGATTDLFTNAENAAYGDMLGTANQVNAQIENKADSEIEATITEGIDSTVADNQAELKKLLEEYYALRLQGITDSPRFRELEEKIRQTMLGVNGAYQDKIDALFAEQGM